MELNVVFVSFDSMSTAHTPQFRTRATSRNRITRPSWARASVSSLISRTAGTTDSPLSKWRHCFHPGDVVIPIAPHRSSPSLSHPGDKTATQSFVDPPPIVNTKLGVCLGRCRSTESDAGNPLVCAFKASQNSQWCGATDGDEVSITSQCFSRAWVSALNL